MSGEPDDDELTGGAYVLGVLEPEEAHEVEQLAERNAALSASIDAWRTRLAPLATAVRPVAPPPQLWRRIETTLGFATPAPAAEPAPVLAARSPSLKRLRSKVRFWRFATAGALAMAAAFAGVAYVEHRAPPQFTASLLPANAPNPVFLARLEPDGALLIRPLANVPVQSGKDLELWALPEGAKAPRSLGVLPAIGRRLTVHGLRPAGTQLLISLEPAGGSPTGAPTGPVLYGGPLEQLD